MSAPSPAETLREAARLMRERAGLATGGQPVRGAHPWKVTPNHRPGVAFVTVGMVRIAQTDERIGQADHNAEHIASWHPAVALAVADWLELTVALAETAGRYIPDAALNVARAYLGGAA